MALVSIQGPDAWLGFPISALGGKVYTAFSTTTTFDAVNDSYAVIFEAPKDGDLFNFEFRLAAGFTGTLRVGVVDLSGGGQFPGTTPTFSHYADIVNPSSGWQAPGGYLGTGGAGSGSKKTVAKGELVCLCWSCTAFTSGAATLSLWNNGASSHPWGQGVPYYGSSNAGGGWAATTVSPLMSLYYDNAGSKETSATPVDPNCQPFNTTETSVTIDSGNPKMAGLKFRVAAEIAIDGAFVVIDPDATTTPRLVKTGTTTDLISAATLKSAQRKSTSIGGTYIRFDSVTIEANTWYRLLFENSGSATNVTFRSYDCNDTGDMAAAGSGADFHFTKSDTAFASLTGTDGTDYTDTTTTCPLVALHIAQMHDGTGGGGGTVFVPQQPGLTGVVMS